jgi:hypothetical protein
VGYDTHADILMMRHCDLLYVDVQVSRPNIPARIKSCPGAWQNVPLQSTLAREAVKTNKYKAISTRNNYKFIPCIIETFGGLGPSAQRFLKQLTASAIYESPLQLLQHIRKRLSVTLHIGNANVLLQAMQQLHHKLYEERTDIRQNASYNRKYYYQVTKPGTLSRTNTLPVNSNVLQGRLNRTYSQEPLTDTTNHSAPQLSQQQPPAVDFACNVESADISSVAEYLSSPALLHGVDASLPSA